MDTEISACCCKLPGVSATARMLFTALKPCLFSEPGAECAELLQLPAAGPKERGA